MITYESLKELALVFAKITGCRYISFDKEPTKIDINFSDERMIWLPTMNPLRRLETAGFWTGFWDYYSLSYHGEILDIDWSQCQFDCKELEE